MENDYDYRTSVHESCYDKIDFSISIEAIQDQAMMNHRVSQCLGINCNVLDECDVQDWTDVYENCIKDLDFDAIVKKYDVKFYEPQNGLMVLKIYY